MAPRLKPSTAPTTFSSFPLLPLELRNEIWSLSLPPPRLIHVQTEKGKIHIPGREPNRKFSHVWVKKVPVPAILQVCRDSRAIGLKHYELIFDSNSRPAKEQFPDLGNLPTQRGGRGLVFPFERRAMIYVDLERDMIVTSHRRAGYRPPRGGWPKDEMEDRRFAQWPVTRGLFKVETFREVVPRETYTRIRTFVARFTWTLNEIFNRRFGRGMASRRKILVVKDPFLLGQEGEYFIDELRVSGAMAPGLQMKGKIRSLTNLVELEQEMRAGTLWDWVVDPTSDKRTAEYEDGILS